MSSPNSKQNNANSNQVQLRFENVQLSIRYLRAIATSHTNAISALLELVDNYVDLLKKKLASVLYINNQMLGKGLGYLLLLANDGPGMYEEDLNRRFFGFGFSSKDKDDRDQIGEYGQGVNCAIAHFGSECVVFSQPAPGVWILALFSKTLMSEYGQEQKTISVKFAINSSTNHYQLVSPMTESGNLSTILKYSAFKTEDSIEKQIIALESTNCKMCFAIHIIDWTTFGVEPEGWSQNDMRIKIAARYARAKQPVWETSLRHRLELNYIEPETLRPLPNLNIFLCNRPIKQFDLLENMQGTVVKRYKPSDNSLPPYMCFGSIVTNPDSIFRIEFYGVFTYKGGRLYEWGKYGEQIQMSGLGRKTVGVVNFDALEASSNKESFLNTKRFENYAKKLADVVYNMDPSSKANRDHKTAAKEKKLAEKAKGVVVKQISDERKKVKELEKQLAEQKRAYESLTKKVAQTTTVPTATAVAASAVAPSAPSTPKSKASPPQATAPKSSVPKSTVSSPAKKPHSSAIGTIMEIVGSVFGSAAAPTSVTAVAPIDQPSAQKRSREDMEQVEEVVSNVRVAEGVIPDSTSSSLKKTKIVEQIPDKRVTRQSHQKTVANKTDNIELLLQECESLELRSDLEYMTHYVAPHIQKILQQRKDVIQNITLNVNLKNGHTETIPFNA